MGRILLRSAFLLIAVLLAEAALAAPVWPGDPGYTGDAYQTWINDGTEAVADKVNIVAVDFARDTTGGNEFFFWRIHVVDQANQQLVAVAHAVFIDVEGDGINDYVLYNTTTGAGVAELAYWDTSQATDQWSGPPGAPAQDYSGLGYTNDSSSADNFIELALPAADIGSPPVIFQAAALDTGALDMDGNTYNGPGPSFIDSTAKSSGPVVPEPTTVLTMLALGGMGVAMRRKLRRKTDSPKENDAARPV